MIKWVIQNNLIKETVLYAFKKAFKELSIDFEEVKVIPFSDKLPEFTPVKVNIFYGSTTLMLNAFNSQYNNGVFYDPEVFNSESYLKHWGNHMLNFDGKVQKFSELIRHRLNTRESWFIRPDSDDKSFAGGTMTSREIERFYSKIQNIDNPQLNTETLIFTAKPKRILKEWRTFIVAGKVVEASRYVQQEELDISNQDKPQEMIDFTEKRAEEFAPHDIFVMDIAEIDEGFRIIECNCFNGTGFYDHNIKEIVKSITEQVKKLELNDMGM